MDKDIANDISVLINNRVEAEFKKLEEDARAHFDKRMAALEDFDRRTQREIEFRSREIEERVTRDVRTRVFSIALSVVVLSAGTMLVGSFTATREVNNSVIALQKDIISAQTTIKTSADSLLEQKNKLSEAQTQLKMATGELNDAREQLKTITVQLEKASQEFEQFKKQWEQAKAAPSSPQPKNP